jgi:hypothetical protein
MRRAEPRTVADAEDDVRVGDGLVDREAVAHARRERLLAEDGVAERGERADDVRMQCVLDGDDDGVREARALERGGGLMRGGQERAPVVEDQGLVELVLLREEAACDRARLGDGDNGALGRVGERVGRVSLPALAGTDDDDGHRPGGIDSSRRGRGAAVGHVGSSRRDGRGRGRGRGVEASDRASPKGVCAFHMIQASIQPITVARIDAGRTRAESEIEEKERGRAPVRDMLSDVPLPLPACFQLPTLLALDCNTSFLLSIFVHWRK